MDKIYVRPKWYGRGQDGNNLLNLVEMQRYQAFKVPKDSELAKTVYTKKYLSMLKDDFVWKIITFGKTVYVSNEGLMDDYDIIKGKK